MSATVSSGGVVSQGGPYYMISRALGPCVGVSVGVMYWLAITMLSVLEVLGAVEGILMISSDVEFPGCKQAYGSALMACLVLFVYGGINCVTRLGLFFVLVVFSTLFMFYFGLLTTPNTPQAPDIIKSNPFITGISFETFQGNLYSHYSDGANFGYVLSVFFPCFTGILSGANRADILRDPPKNLRQGTFGAIIFSLVMYSSYMILWGMVANYEYLQGKHWPDGHEHSGYGRRLAGGGVGTYVVDEIVWNPFPHAAKVGIIISSLSQALQCLVVAPRLLNAIAKDKILQFFNPFAPLSRSGEPARALFGTYVIAGLLVLIGSLDIVAPLLSMCFLVAYAFMNFSCFALTWLKSPAWRPKGIQRKRWRLWYLGTSFSGFLICLTIMFTIDHWWALASGFLACSLYAFVNWKHEARGWGSAMDGIRFQLALNSLISLEESQSHSVNWRPQVLILYRIDLIEELKGIKHHEILRFYAQLRKGNGFCVVACVLEGACDEGAMHKARIEKDIIKNIMKQENIQGFAEVVVAPSWVEGANYIIQLTGIGGLVPNTVLLDWPTNWRTHKRKAVDFTNVLRIALAEEKAVLAVRGMQDMPTEVVHGTIDIWWMIHDGGFLILLSWLLVQHRTWRKCHLRIFTLAEGVNEAQAKSAAEMLGQTLRKRRLFDVDVEVILADDEMIEPYTYDWTLRVEERHKFLSQLHPATGEATEAIPLEIDDLFQMEADNRDKKKDAEKDESPTHGIVSVTDVRTTGSMCSGHVLSQSGARGPRRPSKDRPSFGQRSSPIPEASVESGGGDNGNSATLLEPEAAKTAEVEAAAFPQSPTQGPILQAMAGSHGFFTRTVTPEALPPSSPRAPKEPSPKSQSNKVVSLDDLVTSPVAGAKADGDPDPEIPSTGNYMRKMASYVHNGNVEAFHRLNQIIHTRSKRAQLVVMNLPDLWGTAEDEVMKFMSYCDTLTKGLDRVLFVHSSGHEIFDLDS